MRVTRPLSHRNELFLVARRKQRRLWASTLHTWAGRLEANSWKWDFRFRGLCFVMDTANRPVRRGGNSTPTTRAWKWGCPHPRQPPPPRSALTGHPEGALAGAGIQPAQPQPPECPPRSLSVLVGLDPFAFVSRGTCLFTKRVRLTELGPSSSHQSVRPGKPPCGCH